MFTLTETETDKKWVVSDCVEVFILTETDTVTDVNEFQTHFIGLGLCFFQCEHTLNPTYDTPCCIDYAVQNSKYLLSFFLSQV